MDNSSQDILDQLRKLPLAERERVIAEARLELERERDAATGVDVEIERRALDAIANPGKGRPTDEVFARAHAAVDAVHSNRPAK